MSIDKKQDHVDYQVPESGRQSTSLRESFQQQSVYDGFTESIHYFSVGKEVSDQVNDALRDRWVCKCFDQVVQINIIESTWYIDENTYRDISGYQGLFNAANEGADGVIAWFQTSEAELKGMEEIVQVYILF